MSPNKKKVMLPHTMGKAGIDLVKARGQAGALATVPTDVGPWGGAITFDDSTGEVSGHWVPGRPPAKPGVLFYLWVDDIDAAVERVRAEGCEIVQGLGGDPGELTARFRDPGGSIVGLYEEPRAAP